MILVEVIQRKDEDNKDHLNVFDEFILEKDWKKSGGENKPQVKAKLINRSNIWKIK